MVGFLSLSGAVLAQKELTLDSAIDKALKQNFGLQSAQMEIQEATNNVTRGNAGFLPTVTLNAALTPNVLYLDQINKVGTSSTEVNRAALSNNINGGINLGYTLLDGRKRYFTYDRLKALNRYSELSLKIRVEQLISDVSKAYYYIIRQQRNYKLYAEEMSLFEERLRLAQTRLDVGKGNNLDVLQAEVDLNTQKSLLLRQEGAVTVAKISLAQLITEQEYGFAVRDSTPPFNKNLKLEELKSALKDKSLSLAQYKVESEVLELVLKEVKSQSKFHLYVNGNLTYNRTDNQAGISLLNQNIGLSPGLTATMPLFEGYNIKRQTDNATLEIVSNRLKMQQIENDLNSALMIAWQNFQNALQVLVVEEQSILLAKQSIDIAQERFRLGRATLLDLKQIQKTYEDAVLRDVAARFDARAAEIDLMRLSGMYIR